MKPVPILVVISFAAISANAHAFGINDVFMAGMHAAGELGGAAIDKVKDSMRDPEAEKRKEEEQQAKMAEGLRKTLAGIEARKDLTPLQRERLVISARRAYTMALQIQGLQKEADAQRRAQDDQLFTAQGLMGVTARSVMATPTVMDAKAEAAVKAGIPQAQSRAAVSAIDDHGNAKPYAQFNPFAIAQAQVTQQQANQAVQEATATQAGAVQQTMDRINAKLPDLPKPNQLSADAFELDKTKTLFVSFQNSPKLTQDLRQYMQRHGYKLVDSTDEADVVYLFEGEYTVSENSMHDGLKSDSGTMYETPGSIHAPANKTTGEIKGLFAKAVLGLAAIQNPTANIPKAQSANDYSQDILIVAARQPKDEQETRVSINLDEKTSEIVADQMNTDALNKLLAALKLPDLSTLSGQATPAVASSPKVEQANKPRWSF